MRPATDKRGYVITEAAIFLPVFILAIVSIMYYINIFSVIENAAYSTIEETARLASKAGVVKTAPGFPSVLKSRIKTENTAAGDVKISSFRYLYWDGNLDNMISVKAEYDMELKLPMGFDHKIELVTSVKCRGFTGLRIQGVPMTFDEMEAEGSWDPVWIFPMSGEKYHRENCTYVKANARQMVLTGELKKQYASCSLCKASGIPMGSYVYCFTENGSVYHSSDCRQINRYTIEINKSDAIDKGYASCSKCGGG